MLTLAGFPFEHVGYCDDYDVAWVELRADGTRVNRVTRLLVFDGRMRTHQLRSILLQEPPNHQPIAHS